MTGIPEPSRQEMLAQRADFIALALAHANEGRREAYNDTLKSLTVQDTAHLLLAAVDVVSSTVRISDGAVRIGQPAPLVRDVLAALAAECRRPQA